MEQHQSENFAESTSNSTALASSPSQTQPQQQPLTTDNKEQTTAPATPTKMVTDPSHPSPSSPATSSGPELLNWGGNEIVFYDIETTWTPPRDIIEFGAIVLDKWALYEKEVYSTMIHSPNITPRSVECNGITKEMVQGAASFSQVADRIFSILNGRIWAGHNIVSFDNKEIERAFARIDRPAPKPSGVLDTYLLLKKSFGQRVGNLKVATLGQFYGLGLERHRALSDCRMTLDVFKNCCMVLMLEQMCNVSLVPPAHVIPPPVEKPATPTKRTSSAPSDKVVEAISQAMDPNGVLYVKYNGGSYPGQPRMMKPIEWKTKPHTFTAHCFISNLVKQFSANKVSLVSKEEYEAHKHKLKNSNEKPKEDGEDEDEATGHVEQKLSSLTLQNSTE